MDEKSWQWHDFSIGTIHQAEGLKVELLKSNHAYFVSGKINNFFSKLDLEIPVLGISGIASNNFALKVARDKLFLSQDTKLSINEGWNSEGVALSRVDRLFQCLSISGEYAENIIKQGTSCPLDSPSCAVSFFGIHCFLTRSGKGFFIFVEPHYIQYLFSQLIQGNKTIRP